jgi:hypothetical protein
MLQVNNTIDYNRAATMPFKVCNIIVSRLHLCMLGVKIDIDTNVPRLASGPIHTWAT